jgi:hypothetical protein
MTTEITQSPADEVRTLRQRVLRAGGIAGFALAQVIRRDQPGDDSPSGPEMFGVMAISTRC